jgi:hypothetical protein
MSLYRGAGGASDATDDSTVNAVAGYASSAASSATAAAASASTASSNADAAAASAASAASNVSQAATSASNALTSASNASTSATNAASSATSAANSATAANVSAGSAATAAANASSSASSSSTHATSASNSATAAAGSATAAAASAASALAIYGNTAAMAEAVADAVEAAANAQQEAQSANDSAIAAEEAKSDAYEHEQNAAEWASQAQGSANSAQGFSTAAQAARDATLQAYDNFDDRYLGTKSADPTVDNDGNPLVAGALYFNDQTNMMMLRAGGVWVAAYTSGGSPSFGNTVVNGTLNVTGVSTFSAGTATAPAITTTGDSNTGIFFPAADTIAFTEGGVEAMRLDANGRLGLGTTSPSARLDVRGLFVQSTASGDLNTTVLGGIAGTSNGYEIIQSAGNALTYRWRTGANGTAMVLDSNSNLGVGVTPTNVAGSRKLEIGGTTNSALVLSTNSGNAAARNWAVAANFNSFGDYVFLQSNALGGDPVAAGTARMAFSPAGNVGIATTSPATTLQVGNSAGLRQISIYGGGYDLVLGTSGGSIFGFASQAISTVFNTTAVPLGIGTLAAQPLILATSGVERARLTNTGLGIGTTLPLTPFVVSNGSNENFEVFVGAASINGGGFQYINRDTATTRPDFNYFLSGGGGAHKFYTNGSERARIDASGNLIQSAPTTPPTLATNGQMVFNLTSNTNLRVSVRGSDGVTRTANITLA